MSRHEMLVFIAYQAKGQSNQCLISCSHKQIMDAHEDSD